MNNKQLIGMILWLASVLWRAVSANVSEAIAMVVAGIAACVMMWIVAWVGPVTRTAAMARTAGFLTGAVILAAIGAGVGQTLPMMPSPGCWGAMLSLAIVGGAMVGTGTVEQSHEKMQTGLSLEKREMETH